MMWDGSAENDLCLSVSRLAINLHTYPVQSTRTTLPTPTDMFWSFFRSIFLSTSLSPWTWIVGTQKTPNTYIKQANFWGRPSTSGDYRCGKESNCRDKLNPAISPHFISLHIYAYLYIATYHLSSVQCLFDAYLVYLHVTIKILQKIPKLLLLGYRWVSNYLLSYVQYIFANNDVWNPHVRTYGAHAVGQKCWDRCWWLS